MCGRFEVDAEEPVYAGLFGELKARVPGLPQKEMLPGGVALVRTAQGVAAMRWGFSRPGGGGRVINARSETAAERKLFAAAFASARCLIPAAAYFEWNRGAGAARGQKCRLARRDGAPLYLAGLYRSEPDETLPAFVILTREARGEPAALHDRMPVVLRQRDCLAFLADAELAEALCGSLPPPLRCEAAERSDRPAALHGCPPQFEA